jgi:hypothetical protein
MPTKKKLPLFLQWLEERLVELLANVGCKARVSFEPVGKTNRTKLWRVYVSCKGIGETTAHYDFKTLTWNIIAATLPEKYMVRIVGVYPSDWRGK